MTTDDTTSELRQKLQEAHNRFHGRFTTHAEVAKHSRWTAQELENVQIEDEELYYDELLALLAAQRQRWEVAARIGVLKPLANKTVPRGDDVHPEYTKGFLEMQGKVKFELQRLTKLAALGGELGKEQ